MAAKKILVIDDSTSIRKQVAVVLTEGGYDVLEAVDGLDGLEKITKNTDLAGVICDVNMPRMSGLEMVEKVQASGRTASLPILMLTTEGQPSLIKRAKDAGARAWIIKPFKPDLLVSAMKKLAG